MTKTTRLIAISLCSTLAAIVLFNGPASADDSQTRKEIEEIYAKRVEAIKKKNFAYLKSHESDDYTEKTKEGTVKNRQEADAEADDLFGMVREVKEYSLKVDTIKEDKTNNEIIVETSDSGSFSLVTPDNKAHEVIGRGRSREVWKRTKQGWKLKYHEELGDSYVEMDGKPIKD